MKASEIEELIRLMKKHGVAKLEVEESDSRVSISIPKSLLNAKQPVEAVAAAADTAAPQVKVEATPSHGAEVADVESVPVFDAEGEVDEAALKSEAAPFEPASASSVHPAAEAGENATCVNSADASSEFDSVVGSPSSAPGSSSDLEVPENWIAVTSPVVGTFHAAPAPHEEDFVTLGKAVAANKTLGVVTAMNIGNRIKNEEPGVVRRICVKDGDPVQYGTVLFYLEPADELVRASLGMK